LTISENKAHIQNLQRLLINHDFYDKKCLILSSFLDIGVYIIKKTVKYVFFEIIIRSKCCAIDMSKQMSGTIQRVPRIAKC